MEYLASIQDVILDFTKNFHCHHPVIPPLAAAGCQVALSTLALAAIITPVVPTIVVPSIVAAVIAAVIAAVVTATIVAAVVAAVVVAATTTTSKDSAGRDSGRMEKSSTHVCQRFVSLIIVKLNVLP